MPYCDTQCFIRSMKKSVRTPASDSAASTTDIESNTIADGGSSSSNQTKPSIKIGRIAQTRELKDDDQMTTARRTRARKRHGGTTNNSSNNNNSNNKTSNNAAHHHHHHNNNIEEDENDDDDEHSGDSDLSRTTSTSPKRSNAATPSERFLRNLIQGTSEPYSVERRIDLDGLAGKRDCDACRVKVAHERLNIVCGVVKVHALVCAECAERVESRARPPGHYFLKNRSHHQ